MNHQQSKKRCDVSGKLFQFGTFTLASGAISQWKIECDELTSEEWQCLAYLGHKMLPAFGDVVGVPRGGWPFAQAMRAYATEGPTLVVDDVFTTGGTMRKHLFKGDLALVAFARNPPPSYIKAIWTLGGVQ
jgi:orotate phosphoribosyltransferase